MPGSVLPQIDGVKCALSWLDGTRISYFADRFFADRLIRGSCWLLAPPYWLLALPYWLLATPYWLFFHPTKSTCTGCGITPRSYPIASSIRIADRPSSP